ncbi:MAG: asparagine synthetase B [Candidatus Bathyarchaeota archaeon]|nr:asparagine synthetase B [Candidatus Bathyarchaeota archaeon]
MGAIIAALNKKDDNAAEAAITMLKTLSIERSTEALGIASSHNVEIEKSIEALKDKTIKSPIIIGYVFSKILESDKPQPIMLKDATFVFDGRFYPNISETSNAENAAEKLQQKRKENIKKFIQKTEGDFAFVIAETERLLAARDAMGLRPLYYGENIEYVALASERKALWKIGIKNVNSFPPGHMAFINKNGFKLKSIKKLDFSKTKPTSMHAAIKELQSLLQKSVEERVSGLKEVAVAFSGGLDSSLIVLLAKNLGVNVKLIHVGLKKQPETQHAEKAAEALELPIYSYLYEEEAVAETLPKVLWLIEEPDPLKASIGIPFYWVAENTAKMKLRVLLAGQGADELFGGYKRYVNNYKQYGSERVQENIFNDIIKMYENNLERDFKICNFYDVELRLPFATYFMAKFAVSLPLELKIKLADEGVQKIVLRRFGEKLGLPQWITERQKRAIQYATGVNKILKKLANSKGLSQKEYLQQTFQNLLKRMLENG